MDNLWFFQSRAQNMLVLDFPEAGFYDISFTTDRSVKVMGCQTGEKGSLSAIFRACAITERLLNEVWVFTGKVRKKENESVAAIAAEMR